MNAIENINGAGAPLKHWKHRTGTPEHIDFFHQYDLPVILHSCGGIEEAIPTFIEAGYDFLDVRILETGDRELIKKETIKLISGMKERNARFVFGSDHSVSAGVAYDDYQYMLDVYRDNMIY